MVGMLQYNFVRNVFNLRTVKKLNQYNTPDILSANGVLYNVLQANESNYDQNHELLVALDHWLRNGSLLAFDSMKICEKLDFNPMTQAVVGWSHNAFHLDVIKDEFIDIMKDEELAYEIVMSQATAVEARKLRKQKSTNRHPLNQRYWRSQRKRINPILKIL
jgi:hypothetical protein